MVGDDVADIKAKSEIPLGDKRVVCRGAAVNSRKAGSVN